MIDWIRVVTKAFMIAEGILEYYGKSNRPIKELILDISFEEILKRALKDEYPLEYSKKCHETKEASEIKTICSKDIEEIVGLLSKWIIKWMQEEVSKAPETTFRDLSSHLGKLYLYLYDKVEENDLKDKIYLGLFIS